MDPAIKNSPVVSNPLVTQLHHQVTSRAARVGRERREPKSELRMRPIHGRSPSVAGDGLPVRGIAGEDRVEYPVDLRLEEHRHCPCGEVIRRFVWPPTYEDLPPWLRRRVSTIIVRHVAPFIVLTLAPCLIAGCRNVIESSLSGRS